MIRIDDRGRDLLAAQFVLGVQTERVRRRMTAWIDADPRLAERVEWWNDHLAPMVEGLEPVAVPPDIWQRIETALGRARPHEKASGSWWNNAMPWRWSTAVAAALVAWLVLAPAPEPVVPTLGEGVVLVLTDEESRTAWLVSQQNAEAPLMANPMQLPVLNLQQAYELWLLPPDTDPISLGLLSDSEPTELVVPASVRQLLEPGYTMAVSIEPQGGSPTGLPTGPVVFTGSVKSL